jgi:hypothetical protein
LREWRQLWRRCRETDPGLDGSGWVGSGGVGVAEGAGELEDAGSGLSGFPAFVFDDVVVSAQRCEVAWFGGPALGPVVIVVQVTVGGGHPTSGEDTGVIS